MPLADWQLTYNGLTLGAGTAYGISDLRGLDDLPELRTSDTPRPQDHGEYPGIDYAAGRTVDVALTVTAATDAAFRAAIQALEDATILRTAETALSFQNPGMASPRRVNARPRRRSIPNDWDHVFRIGRVALQFHATDPRVYDDNQSSSSTAAATSGGGRTYNRVYNLTYAAGGAGGSITATNNGNFPTRPTARIDGPVTDPRIENVTAGKFLQFSGLTLAAGDWLDIDFANRTVLLNGTASRYGFLTSTSSFWELAPGANEIKFTSGSATGTLTLTWRSAWL